MSRSSTSFFVLTLTLFSAFAQTNDYPYILKTLAGTFPLGDGGPATSALLYYPYAAVPDASGNLYILDAANFRVRKVTPDGKISTYAQLAPYTWDMKLASDGSLYIGAEGSIIRISPSGVQSTIAGTGTVGYSGDGGLAAGAEVGEVYGLALDAAGNIYFSDVSSGHRIREITTDGKIQTIAGTAFFGYNGDNRPALSAALYYPDGVAVDSSGNIYVADSGNSRVRKFTVGGPITTIAGNGNYGPPATGPATASPFGAPEGLWLDSTGNLYVADADEMVVVKIAAPLGTLSLVAGNYNEFSAPGDGPATARSLDTPINVSLDSSGNLYIPQLNHTIRKMPLPAGSLTTIAGLIHFAGDNGPAAAALLNAPDDMALDPAGNVFIADAMNYRIRKVGPNGTIATWGGDGIPNFPANGASVASSHLPYIYSMVSDPSGALYLGAAGQIFKVTPDGKISVIAGTGDQGDFGDGGPATSAHLYLASGLALDSAGNLYVADAMANRVRIISLSSGIIQPFAGSGSHGFSGDGGLATSAQIDIRTLSIDTHQTPLAVDRQGNVYIGDVNNFRIRMVSPQGIITTVVGNGNPGIPSDGALATGAPFSDAVSMAIDSAGILYISSYSFDEIYRVSSGHISRISGASFGSLADGSPAISAFFRADGLKVDANGDLYAADEGYNTVRKLILNSPVSFTIADGNNQSAQPGQALPKALKVQLMGRAGVGVAGITVNFAVSSGSATLSLTSTTTDADGFAGVALTLPAAGTAVITATAAGTTMPVVQFTETAVAAAPTCSVPQPAIVSVNSASDFGGSSVFAPGSWLEIKGTNLAQTTRPWSGADFNGTTAPTSLDGVSVTIDGKPAFVAYVSPTQINVQAPADTASGAVPLVVTTAACSSTAVTVQEAVVAPGLLAPAAFNVAGTQYLAATFSDGTFVGSAGMIPGVAFRPAGPGDTISAYGIGFGATTPPVLPGSITAAPNTLSNVTVAFGSVPATVAYAGLAPGTVGLFQFNIVVPDVPDGDSSVFFQVGTTRVGQSVYLTIQH